MKNPEKYIDINFVKKTSTYELVKSNQEMVEVLKVVIAAFTDFKKYALQALTSSTKANQYK